MYNYVILSLAMLRDRSKNKIYNLNGLEDTNTCTNCSNHMRKRNYIFKESLKIALKLFFEILIINSILIGT